MSPDAKEQIKSAAKTTAVVAGSLGIGIIALQMLIPQPPKRAYLKWDNGGSATVTDVWATTNFKDWTMIGSVTNTNVFRMPNIGPRGFFRVSHRLRADGTME